MKAFHREGFFYGMILQRLLIQTNNPSQGKMIITTCTSQSERLWINTGHAVKASTTFSSFIPLEPLMRMVEGGTGCSIR